MPNPEQRIPLSSIRITRLEGPPCTESVTGFPAANAVLRKWSEDAPKRSGYDKCAFTLTYEDGVQYEGRYDLRHWQLEAADLLGHVRGFVSTHAGLSRPMGLDDRQYEQFQRHNEEQGTQDRMLKFWREYDLGGQRSVESMQAVLAARGDL